MRIPQILKGKRLKIVRIFQFNKKEQSEVAEEISRLLASEKYVRYRTPEEIIRLEDRFYCLIDENTEEILGVVSIRVADGYLGHLVIKPQYRRLGLAKLLVLFAIDVAIQHGNSKIFCHVRKQNKIAQKFFESLGFQKVGEEENSYVYELIVS